jgi:hypothetical protein
LAVPSQQEQAGYLAKVYAVSSFHYDPIVASDSIGVSPKKG